MVESTLVVFSLSLGSMESLLIEVVLCEDSICEEEDSLLFDAVIASSVGPISLLVVVLFVRISMDGSIMRDIEDVDIEDFTGDVVVFKLSVGEELLFVDAADADVVGITGRLVFFCVEDVTITLVELTKIVFEESRPMTTLLELDSD